MCIRPRRSCGFATPGGVRGAVIRAIGDALGAAGYRAASTVAEDVVGAFRVPEFGAGMAAGPVAPSTAFGGPPPPLRGGGSPTAAAAVCGVCGAECAV